MLFYMASFCNFKINKLDVIVLRFVSILHPYIINNCPWIGYERQLTKPSIFSSTRWSFCCSGHCWTSICPSCPKSIDERDTLSSFLIIIDGCHLKNYYISQQLSLHFASFCCKAQGGIIEHNVFVLHTYIDCHTGTHICKFTRCGQSVYHVF